MGIAIIRYNMSNITGGHAAFLDSSCLVDSITYNAVDFSMPTGKLRVQGDAKFTHFAARIAGEWRVFEITGIHAINASVIEYTYTLDYIKDCMLNTYDFTNNALPEWFYSPIVDRVRIPGATSDAPEDYDFCNEYADDPMFKFTRKLDKTTRNCGRMYSYELGRGSLIALVVANGVEPDGLPYVYLLTATNLRGIFNYLNTSQYASAFYKQILGCYLIPNAYIADGTTTTNLNGLFITSVSLDYTAKDDDGNTFSDIVLPSVLRAQREYATGHIPAPCTTTWSPGSQISAPATNFINISHKKYMVYIPFIGNVPLSPELAVTNQGGFSLYFSFRYNLVDGQMSVQLPYADGLYTAECPMPSITLPSGAQAFSLYSNEQRFKGQMAGGILNMGLQAATGNVAGVIGGTIGMVNNMISKDISDNITMAAGQSYSTAAGWTGAYDDHVLLVSYEETPLVSFHNHVATLGCVCGKPIVRVTQDVTDLIGKSFKFNAESLMCSLNNRYEWQKPLETAMQTEYVLFNTPYSM